MKEANKTKVVTRKKQNRVTEIQRDEMLKSFDTIANGDKTLYNSMVSSYDNNHLVVGTRFDNWLSLKESSPEAKAICESIDSEFERLNKLSETRNLLFNKKGSDIKGRPIATHKVEIVIPKS